MEGHVKVTGYGKRNIGKTGILHLTERLAVGVFVL